MALVTSVPSSSAEADWRVAEARESLVMRPPSESNRVTYAFLRRTSSPIFHNTMGPMTTKGETSPQFVRETETPDAKPHEGVLKERNENERSTKNGQRHQAITPGT